LYLGQEDKVLVEQVHPGVQDGGTIEWAMCAGILGVGLAVIGCLKESVKLDHFLAHLIGPFEYLWSDLDQEGITRSLSYEPVGH
jgi:hypothetical protein